MKDGLFNSEFDLKIIERQSIKKPHHE